MSEKKQNKSILNYLTNDFYGRQSKEVHLFNFSGNIYNKKLSVDFKKFIRGEKKFKNIDRQKKQINKDILSARK